MKRLRSLLLAGVLAATGLLAPAAPATAAPVPLKVLTHNVMFLPQSLFPNWGQVKRADLIAEAAYVTGQDVVVLQEMFDNEASDRLKESLSGQYPHQTPVLGRSRSGWDATMGAYSSATPEDGGVTILSKWPILEKVQYVYADGCGADWFSNKGFVYARLNVDGSPVHVVGTHAQAADTGCADGTGANVRAAQFDELDAFLDARSIPTGEQVVIAGDLNVDRYSAEYATMLTQLDVGGPSFTGHPYSWDAQHNDMADYNDDKDSRQQLDYVLRRNGHASHGSGDNETLAVEAPKWCVTSWFVRYCYTDYADHYPVAAAV
ncbi:sphingomyelin phosphodiesterase [Micromonospora sp. WMMA1363]|uniref:sphingomyelin phosphodiesterase n=1 Tax=Micromonospora sp. WMMA1363 TaxID=3053985 RepID=UPI00259D1F21|nr:sphingomyelin phosphodiesterase [Micromonospora sp. WMMA1363]MDM4719791.1 sphingomyelin phosphodiesterase [Micromonospora sp. WMMA1363]